MSGRPCGHDDHPGSRCQVCGALYGTPLPDVWFEGGGFMVDCTVTIEGQPASPEIAQAFFGFLDARMVGAGQPRPMTPDEKASLRARLDQEDAARRENR